MNLPNRLTCARIALTVLFMFLLSLNTAATKGGALLVFLIASLTDYWDGRIARERGQITQFGKLMDPIADKFLSIAAFVAFVQLEIMPAWMVVIIIARDLMVTCFRFLLPEGAASQTPRSSGKHKTALQFAAIVVILIFETIRETPVWQSHWTPASLQVIYFGMLFIVTVTLWSGVRYIVKNQALIDEFMG